MKKTLLIIVGVAVLVVAAAFFGGMKYAESKNPRRQFSMAGFGANTGGQARVINGQGAQRGGGLVIGEILSKDDKSVTVKLPDGGSKIIFFSNSTEIMKFVSGAVSDLEVGKTISVNGSANSDGSITAQSIQVRPNIQTP